MLGVDIQLPTAQPNAFWYGFVQLLVSAPSKGINNVYLGQQELTGRPLGQFVPLTFSLPASLVTTLKAGGYQDFKVQAGRQRAVRRDRHVPVRQPEIHGRVPDGVRGARRLQPRHADLRLPRRAGRAAAAPPARPGFVMQSGACVPANGGSASVWPNQFSKASSDPWLVTHHDEIQTMSRTCSWSIS